MLHVIADCAPSPSDAVLRGMFAARKSVFVDLLGWDVPVIAGRYEVDQFDTEVATYLVLTDEAGGHLGSTRLLPTIGPHILGDLFPMLCDAPVPMGADTAEITRFCLDRRLRAAERRAVRDTLVTALVDHALATGLHHYTAIAEMGWVTQILSFGWQSMPLGLPKKIGGEMLAALRIDIEATTPARLRSAGIGSLLDPNGAARREAA